MTLQHLILKNPNLKKEMKQVHLMNRQRKLKRKLKEILVQMMKR